MKPTEIVKDWDLNDPLPDVFNNYAIGETCKTSDGRKFIKEKNYEWKLIDATN